ncbi:tumor necrosis factor receptor superfamily member 5-like [Pecten maximus]|uniref:tumor necrosis factor receptor superfamily member 5-like n=1 Tax=Pecten maximus TaxID=6579 RepID=UPI0014590599|nr:tumor necrosis factor receptor superfamily member 5-like [Pecten maximus]
MSDAVCECPEGYYYSRRKKGNYEACFPHTKCVKGYGVTRFGTKTNNTICEACRPGCMYSDVTSATDRCKSCSSCGPFDVLLECGATHNTVCGIQRSSDNFNLNKTLGLQNIRGPDFPLVVVLVLVFSIVLFVLILVLIKLYCWRQKYNVMKGMNGTLNASHLYTDHSSLQYAYAHDGMSSFYFSDASSIAPSMSPRGLP